METELVTENKVLKETKLSIPKTKIKKKGIKSGLLKKKLILKRILRKGKRPTVVVNIPKQERSEIKNIMAASIEEDRRNFFFQ